MKKFRFNLLDAVVAALILAALVSGSYKAYLIFSPGGAVRDYRLKIISAPQLSEGEVFDKSSGRRVGTLRIAGGEEVIISSGADKKIGEKWDLYTLYSDISGEIIDKK